MFHEHGLGLAIGTELRFWAKTTLDGRPGITVCEHSLNAGAIAELISRNLPERVRRLLPPSAPTFVASHDIGKISIGFAQKDREWVRRNGLLQRWRSDDWGLSESDHGKVSAWILRTLFLGRNWNTASAERLAHVIGAHHGRLLGSKVFCKPIEDKATDLTAAERLRLLDEVQRDFGALPDQLVLTDSQLWLQAGLTAVADWIGSDERFFPVEAMPEERSLEVVRANAERAISELNWSLPKIQPGLSFSALFGFDSPSPIQKLAFGTHDPSVVIIEAEMGAGKTEAALSLAYQQLVLGQASGVYFALPTQVTSDRIHLRVREFLSRALAEPAMLRLVHMNSWLKADSVTSISPSGKDDATPAIARQWFSSNKRALLAPFGVGTVDQALLGVVAAKHFFVRQFALAGKVVIIDEVHSYDLYTGTLVKQLVSTLRGLGATVVILSATLTGQKKRELLGLPETTPLKVSYPLFTVSRSDGQMDQTEAADPTKANIRVQVKCVRLSEEEAARECLKRAAKGECVLWIRNTVAAAQAAMRRLNSMRNGHGPEVALLHSRFPLFRRQQLERFWIGRLGKNPRRRPRGCVLVATQVVEQSVDIDADFLLTDLAPSDMLLQRIGRLWRHQARPEIAARRPAQANREVWINCPTVPPEGDAKELKRALGKSALVYAPYILMRSLEQWEAVAKRGFLVLPTDIRPLIEDTYNFPGEDGPAGLTELRQDLVKEAQTLEGQALATTRVWTRDELADEEGVQTRWSPVESASLLLVRSMAIVGGCLKIEPLCGPAVTIKPDPWKSDPQGAFVAAKTLHRNLVRVDRKLVRQGEKCAIQNLGPAANSLGQIVHGNVAVGIVESSGQKSSPVRQKSWSGPIRWPGKGNPDSKLCYDPNIGVERVKSTGSSELLTSKHICDETDESCD